MGSSVKVERAGGVVTVTLNKPDIRNAMDEELTEQFASTMVELRNDTEVRAVIITGAGSAFCAGGDLSWIQPGPDASVPEMRRKMRIFYRKFLSVRDLEVPTIAAINGPAVGAGMCVALACDIRLAADGSFLSAPFTKLGMHPGMAASYLLTRLVGGARAAELFYTARRVDAVEAASIGLVNRVVPADKLLDEAREMAETIAANAPIAMTMTKRAVQLAERLDLEAMLEIEGLAQPITMGTHDMTEGVTAAREKRAPNFQNR
jgi:enoyl-CoA hydratase/carnithine racemase